MARDSVYLDSAALEELRWLSACITVGGSSPEATKYSVRSTSSFASDPMKRKRDTAFPPRPYNTRRPTTAARRNAFHDTTDSESEKRDVITPLRFQHAQEVPTPSKPVVQKDEAREAQAFLYSLENATDTLRNHTKQSARRVTAPQPLISSDPIPVPEIIQASSSLPTRPSLNSRRQTGYYEAEPESLPDDASLRGRKKPLSIRSLDHHMGLPPLWTSIIRPKSKAQRSVPSLKGRPSQSLSLKDSAPVSFFKSSPIPWTTREPSLDTTESSDSSSDSRPSTPPLTAPRFPAANEDVFGRSSPTWLPDDDAPLVSCRATPPSSVMKTHPRRKDSSASSVTGSSGSILDGTSTPTGSNKSVKFADRPTFHYPSTLYWDKTLEEKHPFRTFNPDMGLDVDGMDLEEIPEIESPTGAAQIDSDSGISMGNLSELPPPRTVGRSPSPARSMTPSMRSTNSRSRFHLFSSKSKEPKPSMKDLISGPLPLTASAHAETASLPSTRPGTPSSLRSVRTYSRSETPVRSHSRTPTPSLPPMPAPPSPGRPRRLVKSPSISSTKSSIRGRKPFPQLSRSAPVSDPAPVAIRSSENFAKSAASLQADAKSIRSTKSEKTRNKKWWNMFSGTTNEEKSLPPLPVLVSNS